MLADSAAADPTGLSRRALEALRQRWEQYVSQLNAWQSTLTDRSQDLGADQDSLARIRAVWEVTDEAAAEEGYPDVAVQTIASVQTTIGETKAATSERLDAVLTLQNQLVELSGEATEVLARIGEAEGEARLGLFKPEQPPLWTAVAAEQPAQTWAATKDTVRRDIQALQEFWRDAGDELLVQFAMLGLFLILIGRCVLVAAQAVGPVLVSHKEEDVFYLVCHTRTHLPVGDGLFNLTQLSHLPC